MPGFVLGLVRAQGSSHMLSPQYRAGAATAIAAAALVSMAASAQAAHPPVLTQRPMGGVVPQRQALFSPYSQSPNATCKWHVVASANPFPDQNDLQSVSATSNRDAWAVGLTLDPSSGNTEPLIEHWDNTAW